MKPHLVTGLTSESPARMASPMMWHAPESTLCEPGHVGEATARIGSREIATASATHPSQEAIAHFGLGNREQMPISS